MTARHIDATGPAEKVNADRMISRTVKAYAAMRDLTPHQLGGQLGFTPATWSRRMNQGGWTAIEVARVAVFLGVPVSYLFEGTVAAPSTVTYELRSAASDPAIVAGEGGGGFGRERLRLVHGSGRGDSATQPPLLAIAR